MANMWDDDRRDEAPVLGERVRRLVGWHGYDWMKTAVALVLAALLLYGNAAGVSDGQPVAATPTSGMAIIAGTQAAPSTTPIAAAPTIQSDAPTATEVVVVPSGSNIPSRGTQAVITESTAATSPTAEAPTASTSVATTALPPPSSIAVVTGTGTTAEQQPADIIVVTDVSGSMAANNRIAGVRTALVNFADLLNPDDRVELITFSDTATVTLPMSQVSEARATMKQIARGLTPGGATTLYDTTLLAFKEMQSSGDPAHKRVIIVLTDGRDERLNANDESIPGSTATLDEALAGIERGGQRGITLFTIGYGANADNDVLQRMADAANGRHFAAGPATIQEVYETIAQSL